MKRIRRRQKVKARVVAIVKQCDITIGMRVIMPDGKLVVLSMDNMKRSVKKYEYENVEFSEGRIRGTENGLDRMPVYNNGVIQSERDRFVLFAEREEGEDRIAGYALMDTFGRIQKYKTSEVIEMAKRGKIVNAKLCKRSEHEYHLQGIKKEIKVKSVPKKGKTMIRNSESRGLYTRSTKVMGEGLMGVRCIKKDNKGMPDKRQVNSSGKNKVRKGVNEVDRSKECAEMKRMKELVPWLAECARVYEQENRELISNREYDALYDELKALEEKTGVVLAGSVTHKVGYEVMSKLPKVKHTKKMLSLDKTKDVGKLKSFLRDKEGILSWKLDGLTIVATYENGELVEAVTRGNGEVGEGITPNYKQFSNIPLSIAEKGKVVLRGEAVIDLPTFDKINEKIGAGEKYKNARNLASGTVRQLNSKITKERNVRFVVFTVVEGFDGEKTKSAKLNRAAQLGFETVDRTIVNKDTVERAVEEFTKRVQNYDIPCDGLVLVFDDIEYSLSLGETEKFPRDGIAFKWQDEEVETKLKEVEWSTSRTGLVNPVAIFEPVDIEGSTVQRASLHNVTRIKELKLGIGDTIKVYKANMIIPEISENLTKSDNLVLADTCPVCGFKLELVKDKDTEVLMCNNINCHAQLVRGLSHFVSRDCMNIVGISGEIIDRLVKEGLIENAIDIYELKDSRDKLIVLDGWGEKGVDKILKAIEASKDVELCNFIASLGIPNVGLGTAKDLCRHFDNDYVKLKEASYADYMSIDGVGDTIASSLIRYFGDNYNEVMATTLANKMRFKKAKVVDTSSPIVGKKFVVTGDVEIFKNRKELQAFIESKGGINVGSVSKETDYLLCNEKDGTSGKWKKFHDVNAKAKTDAERVEHITEKEFMGWFKES